jgi:hypothetical protein
MLETIIVLGIVAVVAVMTGRSLYRAMKGGNGGCGCTGNCQCCQYNNFAEMHQEPDSDIRQRIRKN